jgi:hypothetical protein
LWFKQAIIRATHPGPVPFGQRTVAAAATIITAAAATIITAAAAATIITAAAAATIITAAAFTAYSRTKL